ncbi:hypothetical protein K491DRAFT_722050 [Lophiostoma macrostomum CBS 122681]|uniref:BZIP domain-containing protein n=1 Tax=Lophiostoma macrostomum CBS 122681 TaxID=1314788 RepID=A0A6A6SMV4_9PLEO|nr:hypothetical protein K491DRAFT_722050 [Lophiostoma macrostomum CBS 122681]
MPPDRTVASLTTEQLYRKRAFDRENQRSSRARKKTRIAELEDEVSDLKKRLADAEEEVKRLSSNEAAALREAVHTTPSSIQSSDGGSSQTHSDTSTPPVSAGLAEYYKNDTTSFNSGPSSAMVPIALHDSGPPAAGVLEDDLNRLVYRDEVTGLTLELPYGQNFDMLNFRDENFLPMINTENPISLSFLDSFPAWTSGPGFEMSDHRPSQHLPAWERLPLHIDATCRLDTVLLEVTRAHRKHGESVSRITELSQPVFPSVRSLLNPDSNNARDPISAAIGEHGRVTMQQPNLVKIALMYMMCIFLRWLISPTKRNYYAMPEFLRPVEAQSIVPHPAWIDIILWPEARERVIRLMDWSRFLEFRAITNKSLSINWPHGHAKVFETRSQTELKLSPLFENHIRELRSWTVGPELAATFPFLDIIPTRINGDD